MSFPALNTARKYFVASLFTNSAIRNRAFGFKCINFVKHKMKNKALALIYGFVFLCLNLSEYNILYINIRQTGKTP